MDNGFKGNTNLTLKPIIFLANATSIHTQRWAKHFAKTGRRVYVLSFQDSKIEGVEVIHLKNKISRVGYISALLEVKKVIRAIKPTILHSHYASGYGLLGALTGFHPYIISVWGSDVYEFPNRSFIHKSIFKYNMKKSDYICSTSRDMAKEISKYTDKNILITPFGIDCKEYKPELRITNTPEIIVGTVKKLEEVYGIEHLIKAFNVVVKKYPYLKLRLVIVGGGKLDKSLRQLADELGISKIVEFVGTISQDLVPTYLNRFSVYVALSLSESFGVAVLEASACAVPVVVSNVGGLPEVVVDGETGFIVPSMDVQRAADALEKLVLNEDLRKKMGKAGREFVMRRYQWENNAEIMEHLYGNIDGLLC